MPSYTANSITVNFTTSLIEVPYAERNLDVQVLLNTIREAENSIIGMVYEQIASASGKESLGGSVEVGLTVELNDPWQVHFEDTGGQYIAKIFGGNLVGGISEDPVAYTDGVQVLLLQSAASTVVTTGGSALTAAENAQLMGLPSAEDVWDYERA